MVSSTDHSYTLTTKSKGLRNNNRTGRKVKPKHPDKKDEILQFNTLKATGNCCWKVWSGFKSLSGQSLALHGVGTQILEWNIHYVELNENCEI